MNTLSYDLYDCCSQNCLIFSAAFFQLAEFFCTLFFELAKFHLHEIGLHGFLQ